MKKIDGYYVDSNGNKWNCEKYTRKEAVKASKTLINCRDCYNCSYCSYCNGCCDCTECRLCSFCTNCTECRSCTDCSDYESNPERIVSPVLGSRNSQTTVYFLREKDNTNIQVVCGCFCGNLDEFEQKVKETHNTNEHGIAYMNFIENVKNYIAA